MKYTANFNANNGTSFINPIKDTNLTRIIKSVRETAEGERYAGNECNWSVYDESGKCIAAGGMNRNGMRYRIKDSDLCWY